MPPGRLIPHAEAGVVESAPFFEGRPTHSFFTHTPDTTGFPVPGEGEALPAVQLRAPHVTLPAKQSTGMQTPASPIELQAISARSSQSVARVQASRQTPPLQISSPRQPASQRRAHV